MKIKLAFVFIAACVLANAEDRFAPRLLNYQGFLTDTINNPITNPSVSMTFSIYDASSAGNQKWTEDQSSVGVSKGIFHVLLGGVNPIPDSVFKAGADRWLEMSIAGQALSPRTRIVSVPYAYSATFSDTAIYARNYTPDNDWAYRVTDGADTTLEMGGRWGLARYGNIMYGNVDSTHVNLGVGCVTGANGQNYKYITVSGGFQNTASEIYATVSGGSNNTANDHYASVGGGNNNIAGFVSTIGGGWFNTASNSSTVGGGQLNIASSYGSIGGGQGNIASNFMATIGGGGYNRARGQYSVVGGGGVNSNVNPDSNSAIGNYTVIGGGYSNIASGLASVISGGYNNDNSGDYSMIPGGYADSIAATGDYSYLFGINSNLTQDSTFMVDMPHVWFGTEAAGYEFPYGRGADGQVMKTNGAGLLSWGSITYVDSARVSANAHKLQGKDTADFNVDYVNEGQVNSITNAMLQDAAVTTTKLADTAVTMPKIAPAGATVGQVIKWSGTAWQPRADSSMDSDWSFRVTDGADTTLQMGGRWGLARFGNTLFGNADSTHVNFGVGNTTGTNGQNYKYTTVGGGNNNAAVMSYATVGGGVQNNAGGQCATVSGGSTNTASAECATVAGGNVNTASNYNATVSGGQGNVASGYIATVGGGKVNRARGAYSVVAGGGGGNDADSNSAIGSYSAIGGGIANIARGNNAVISGGVTNRANGNDATVGGGTNNNAGGYRATIGGGNTNTASNSYTTIAGGSTNVASGWCATVGGGDGNANAGDWSAILGGLADSIAASGDYSYLFGINSNLTQDSTFMVDMPHVWFGTEANGYEFPYGRGADGQVMKTNGAGLLSWGSITYIDSARVAANAHKLQGKDTVNFNLDYVNEGQVNSITNAMIQDAAVTTTKLVDTAVVMAKLAPAGASVGQVIKWNGTTWQPLADSSMDSDWSYRITDAADTTLQMGGRWGLARFGNTMYGNADSTHVNLGVGSTSGTNGQNYKYCTVGGGESNTASATYATVGGGRGNQASGYMATVGGGNFNKARGQYSVVSGGGAGNESDSNSAIGIVSTIAGGMDNRVTGDWGAIVGGANNSATGSFSMVSGGAYNTASGYAAVVAGGSNNSAIGRFSMVSGYLNTTSGQYSLVSGGRNNTASDSFNFIGEGIYNYTAGKYSAILGGYADTIFSGANYSYLFGINSNLTQDSTFMVDMPHVWFGTEANGYEFPYNRGTNGQVMVTNGSGQLTWGSVGDNHWSYLISDVADTTLQMGGRWGLARPGNTLYGNADSTHVNLGVQSTTGTNGQHYKYITISGGYLNTASASGTVVGGGTYNTASGSNATIGGGRLNIASGYISTVGGGHFNKARGQFSVVAGGGNWTEADSNSASGDFSAIGGGYRNLTYASLAVISGGSNNTASGVRSTIGGGWYNTAGNFEATVGGGTNNNAGGNQSVVGGGGYNVTTGTSTAIGGGYGNNAGGTGAAIAGGEENDANGSFTSVAGGKYNAAIGEYANIGGGENNYTNSNYSAILGGYADTIFSGANYSYLFGINSNLTQDSTFMVDLPHVWFGTDANGYEFPRSRGTNGQTLVTNGSGQLSWASSNDNDWTISGNNMYSAVSGNVGIGTTTPSAKLEVYNGDINVFFGCIRSNSGFWGDALRTNWGNDLLLRSSYSGKGIVFQIYSGEKMRIDSIGNVGIGVAAPAAKLDVAGTVKIVDGTQALGRVFTSDAGGLGSWQALPGAPVSSVFGRTGAVVAASGDYTTTLVTEGANLYFTDARAQSAITGGASSITTSNLTANRALLSNGSGKVAVSTATNTELGYLSGVTSAIQTQLSGKQEVITGGASTITSSNLTANRALLSDGSGKVAVSTVTNNELGYLSGVTSAIQTQLDGKASLSSPTFTGNVTMPGTGIWNSSGNVGIGNTSPSSKIDVTGANGYDQVRMRTTYTPTGSSDANGNIGDVAWDDGYVYVKTSGGWKRSALSSW